MVINPNRMNCIKAKNINMSKPSSSPPSSSLSFFLVTNLFSELIRPIKQNELLLDDSYAIATNHHFHPVWSGIRNLPKPTKFQSIFDEPFPDWHCTMLNMASLLKKEIPLLTTSCVVFSAPQ